MEALLVVEVDIHLREGEVQTVLRELLVNLLVYLKP